MLIKNINFFYKDESLLNRLNISEIVIIEGCVCGVEINRGFEEGVGGGGELGEVVVLPGPGKRREKGKGLEKIGGKWGKWRENKEKIGGY